jgi:regulator of sigma E protease
VPLGGYVKMLDEREGEVDEAEADRAFNRRPIPARIAVLFAGPAFNFLFAIVAFWVLYVTGVQGIRAYIEDVTPGSVAAEAGLRHDDIIDAVGGQATPTLDQALVAMFDELLGDGIIDLDVVAADGTHRQVSLDVRGRINELTEPDALFDGLGIVLGPRRPAIIELTEDSPAGRAGLRDGDRVTAVDGQPIRDWLELADYVRPRVAQTINVSIIRNGNAMVVPVRTEPDASTNGETGRIGIQSPEDPRKDLVERVTTERRYGPIEAVGVAGSETWGMTALTFRMIGRMLTGQVSLRNASGPLMIGAYAGQAAEAGLNVFLRFLCVISISLGVMNLLPVPILDGGQIVMSLIEGIKGSPLSMRAAMIGQQIGLAMLIALMGFVFYNDITRLLGL